MVQTVLLTVLPMIDILPVHHSPSLVPRLLPLPVFDHLQYANTYWRWERPGNVN